MLIMLSCYFPLFLLFTRFYLGVVSALLRRDFFLRLHYLVYILSPSIYFVYSICLSICSCGSYFCSM